MVTALFPLAKRNRNRALTGFAWDVMAGKGIDVVGPGHRCTLDQVRDELVDPRKLFVCVALGILVTFPKAQSKDLVGLRIGRKENHVHEPRLVFKDWENLVLNGFGERFRFERERITKISGQIRALAKDTGVPILAVSQLNRPLQRNANERPNKFSMKESGSLENDSHTILLIYRPSDEFGRPTGDDEIIIAKQRHGPVSNEAVRFDSRTMTFFDRRVA